MSAQNNCNFIGNFTRDPEGRGVPTKDGEVRVVKFGLGVNGRKKGDVVFVDFEAWGKQAEVIEEHCKKGDKIAIQGEYMLDTWEDKNDGSKRSRPKIRVENFTFLGKKGDAAPAAEPEDDAPRPAKSKTKAKPAPEPEDDDETEIRF